MATKRVLFIVYELPPIGGGVATAAWNLLQEFSRFQDLEVDVVTSSLDNTWSERKLVSNITVYSVPIGQKRHRLKVQSPKEMIFFTIASFFKVAQLVLTKKYSVAHYFGYPGALVGMLFSWNLPYIVSLRGVDVPGYNKKFGLYYSIYKPVTRVIWKCAKAVVANSSKLQQLALSSSSNLAVQVIPNGVDTQLFQPLEEKDKYKKFTVTAGGTVMGPKKNLDILIRAFASFHKDNPDTQLLLIGDGVLKPSLIELVASLDLTAAVEFKGALSKEEVAQVLPRCHVFCLPSENEGMSNAMLEAVAAGLPIVMTDVGGTDEVVGKNGIILAAATEVEITQALQTIYGDVDARIEMGRLSRTVAEKMSWEKVAKKYRDIYYV